MNFKQAMDHLKKGSASTRIRRSGWVYCLSMSKTKGLFIHLFEGLVPWPSTKADLQADDWEIAS